MSGWGGEEQGDPNLPYFTFPVPASLCNGITKGDKGCELQKKIGRVRGGGGGRGIRGIQASRLSHFEFQDPAPFFFLLPFFSSLWTVKY